MDSAKINIEEDLKQLEKTKLELEIKELKKSPLKRPQTIVGVLLVVGSLVTGSYQFITGGIEKKKNELENRELQEKNKILYEEFVVKSNDLAEVEANLKKQSQTLTALKNKVTTQKFLKINKQVTTEVDSLNKELTALQKSSTQKLKGLKLSPNLFKDIKIGVSTPGGIVEFKKQLNQKLANQKSKESNNP